MLGSLEYLVDNSLLFIYQKVKSRGDPSENTMWGRDLGCIKAFWQDLDRFKFLLSGRHCVVLVMVS